MRTFKDNEGRTWSFALNVHQMKRVRAHLGIDLVNVIALDPDGKVKVDLVDRIAGEHVDPSKEATAQEKRLKNHTTTLASEYAKQGKDWESELRQRAKEKELMDELGLTVEETAPSEQGKEDDED